MTLNSPLTAASELLKEAGCDPCAHDNCVSILMDDYGLDISEATKVTFAAEFISDNKAEVATIVTPPISLSLEPDLFFVNSIRDSLELCVADEVLGYLIRINEDLIDNDELVQKFLDYAYAHLFPVD